MPYTPEQLEAFAKDFNVSSHNHLALRQAARDARLRIGVERLRDSWNVPNHHWMADELTALLDETTGET